MIKILVNGAKGRMGQMVVHAVHHDTELTLVSQTDLGDNLAAEIAAKKPDVVVDFTTAKAGFNNTKTIINAGARAVVGTSGFLPDQIDELTQLCNKKRIGSIIAPNFSIGAILMMKYAQDASHYLAHAEIIEFHHDKKADAPSGTAIKTADMLNIKNTITCNETLKGARGTTHKNVQIHSIRLPGFLAHQEVIFGGFGETLTIRHDTLSREAFLPGVCLACKKVMALETLVYGLENIL